MIIYGINTIKELLKTKPKIIKKIFYSGSRIENLNLRKDINFVKKVSKKELNEITGNDDNQGIAILVKKPDLLNYDNLKKNINNLGRVVVILDHIMDTHNLGAIIRSGLFFGIKTFIIPNKRAAAISPGSVKSSSGLIFNSDIYTVSNIINTINLFKENDYWVIGADLFGEDLYSEKVGRYENMKTLLVFGSEGKGLSKLVKDNCDFPISIKGNKNIDSLNVSVAAGIIMSRFRDK